MPSGTSTVPLSSGRRLRRLLDALRGLTADAELTGLQKSIGIAFKSNKHERQILLESFG